MLLLLPKGVKNLASVRFGELTPVSIVEVSKADGAVWECKCSCNRTRRVPAKNLTGKRVTCCTECAKARRTRQLHAAYKASLDRRGDSTSAYQRNWQTHLGRLSPPQREYYDEMIERRRRVGVTITDSIRAGAVEAAMLVPALRAA